MEFYERMQQTAKYMIGKFGHTITITIPAVTVYNEDTGEEEITQAAQTDSFTAVKLTLGSSSTNFNQSIIAGYQGKDVARLLIDAVTAPFNLKRGYLVTIGSDEYTIDQLAPHDPVGEHIYFEVAIIK